MDQPNNSTEKTRSPWKHRGCGGVVVCDKATLTFTCLTCHSIGNYSVQPITREHYIDLLRGTAELEIDIIPFRVVSQD